MNKNNYSLTSRKILLFGIVGFVLVLATIGFGVLVWYVAKPTQFNAFVFGTINTNKPPTASLEATSVSMADHTLGNPDAAVTLIEYADYECPYCKEFHSVIEQMVTDYQDDVRLVFRHFPLSIHPNAGKEAEAAECVAELGGNEAFWQYTSAIFQRTQSGGTGFPLSNLAPLAGELGVDETAFTTCLDSGRYAAYVRESQQTGVRAGVSGTPSVIAFNTFGTVQLIPGQVSYNELKRVIDALLAPAS